MPTHTPSFRGARASCAGEPGIQKYGITSGFRVRAPRGARPGMTVFLTRPGAPTVSGFLEAVADAVEGFDHFEIVIHDLELLAQPLDVAVDGAIVDIDLIVIGSVHQRIAAFHDSG